MATKIIAYTFAALGFINHWHIRPKKSLYPALRSALNISRIPCMRYKPYAVLKNLQFAN